MVTRVGTAGLSPREAEVLQAVAEHLSNAEIAARLFISVRTVESHVAALLRKAGVADRRALISATADLVDSKPETARLRGAPSDSVPARGSTITSFIGRVAERQALQSALREHRLVTALGPGGVGKTRLAQMVMAEVGERYSDGVWYVDLVPIADPEMVAPAIAAVLGLHERQGRSLVDALASWLADRDLLLVLDNCEHLLDGVAALLEQLLLASPRLAVLATSRTRLAVPFERVFPVPGLSTGTGDDPGDAVQLFEARALTAGVATGPELRPRIAALCAGLDGIALAIELAAARLPAMGLDGLEAALADRLPVLSGGRRADDRHRSLRATLDWSYALLTPEDQAVLRRVSVFAAPFSADAAAAVAAQPGSVRAPTVIGVLAELADSSLLIAELGPRGTRYRVLETIRQYGAERLEESGETAAVASAHLAWSVARAEALPLPPGPDAAAWREEFDGLIDDLRAALQWAREREEARESAFRLAERLGYASFARGVPAEAQQRFEQAATLAPDEGARTRLLRAAAGSAEARQFGNESLRLRREAATAFLRDGKPASAAIELARAAELINRGPGILVPRRDPAEALPLLAEARELAGDDPRAVARVLTAEAFSAQQAHPGAGDLARRAVELAAAERDVAGESAALDALCSIQLQEGDLVAATASAMRRNELLESLALVPELGIELADALAMGTECAIGLGDLALAGRLADRLLTLPYYSGEQHLATARPLIVQVLVGEVDDCARLAARFRDGWERAGHPRVSSLSTSAHAAAAAYGFRGDEAGTESWRRIALSLLTREYRPNDFDVASLDALVLLHRGRALAAAERMAAPPEPIDSWYSAMWRPWYAALWAEAAVLAALPDAEDRVERARLIVPPNPIARALVDRAAALLARNRGLLPAIAERFRTAGARYQEARTLLLAGGEQAERGASMLAALGIAPMGRSERADPVPQSRP